MFKAWRACFAPFFVCVFALLALPAYALEVAVALSQPGGPHRQFHDALLTRSAAIAHRFIAAGDSQSGLDERALQRADLIVTVGVQVTQEVLARFRRPTMAVLVSRAQAEALQFANPGATFSAIVLDQPASRHMRLAHAVTPGVAQIGMLFGADGVEIERRFGAAAADAGLTLVSRRVGAPGELLPQLERLLESSDALLMIPDPVVASQSSARTILLTSYRYRRPILAYSRAYVEAGALAAVFSTPEDAARDLFDWLKTTDITLRLPPIQSPQHFSVRVNRQVARSLGLDVPPDEALVERIARQVTP